MLIANTMTTLVGEQTGEIATMKAIGGRRRQIAAVYLRTALLLGALGTLVGVALGRRCSRTRSSASSPRASSRSTPGFGVDSPVLVASARSACSAPRSRRCPRSAAAVRVTVREALAGDERRDRRRRAALDAGAAARRASLPRTAQIGLRGVGRRKRRSLATVLQIALAVGNLLAVLGLGQRRRQTVTTAAGRTTAGTSGSASSVGRPFDARAARLIRATPGVARRRAGR